MPFFRYNEKKIFYATAGDGEPLLLIHDNSLSSKMFNPVIKYYTDTFRVILIDLPGCGKSARLSSFPVDFWYDNSKAVYELIKFLDIPEINIIGTGGGAIIAVNLLLEHPDKVKKVIADSFLGAESVASIAENIHNTRDKEKQQLLMKLKWFRHHGFWWRTVVDQDSDAIYAHHMEIKNFYHKKLSEIDRPVLFTGSLEDDSIKYLIVEVYAELKEIIKGSRSHYFYTSGHPAMISAGEEFARVAREFFK